MFAGGSVRFTVRITRLSHCGSTELVANVEAATQCTMQTALYYVCTVTVRTTALGG